MANTKLPRDHQQALYKGRSISFKDEHEYNLEQLAKDVEYVILDENDVEQSVKSFLRKVHAAITNELYARKKAASKQLAQTQ